MPLAIANLHSMNIHDVTLLAKKIAIGAIIFLVPLIIIAGTIWLIQNH